MNRFATLSLVCALVAASGCTAGRYPPESIERDVRGMLDQQVRAWNRGDVEGFMVPYEHGEGLTFSSGGQTQRGWQATYDRYKQKYPTPTEMGRLEFGELEFRELNFDRTAALVLGRWYLHRTPDPIGGNFSLVLVRAKGRWSIIHDHTSVDPDARPPENLSPAASAAR